MFCSLLFSSLLAVAPIPATGKTPDPIATLTFASVEVLEKDFFRIVQMMPFPDKDATIQKMRDELKKALGEKSWDGIDVKKPGTGYLVFDEKNPEKSYGFIVFPVKDETSFIDLLRRIGTAMDGANRVVTVEGNPGLFHLESQSKEMPVHVRVHNKHAYLGFNAPIDAFAADKLIPPEKTLDTKETAKIAVKVHCARLPKDWIGKGLTEFELHANQGIEEMPMDTPKAMKSALSQLVGLVRKYATQIQTDGDSFGLRVRFDNELLYEAYLKGKPGTTLTSDISSRKPLTNRFGSVITDKAVAGFAVKAPFYNDDLRRLGSKGIVDIYKELCEKDPPPADLKPLFDLLVPRLATTIQSGDVDLAGAVHGPDAKGGYTATVAIALDDAVALTPELKKLIDAKAEGVIEWDAIEADGVKIHKANVVPLLPPEFKKVFGDNGTCHFALTKSGAIVAMGRDSMNEVKRVIAAKPIPHAAIDFKLNPAKIHGLVSTFDNQTAEFVSQMLGKQDRLGTIQSLTITGGDELRIVMNPGTSIFAGATGMMWVR